MKKFALVLAVLMIAAFAVTACSSTETGETASASAEESTAAESAEATEAAASSEETAAPSEETSAASDQTVIRVGASPTPHAEILAQIEDALAAEGYALEIVEFTDYIQPNVALMGGDLDANYFQHITYMNDYNDNNGTNMVSAAGLHYEPFGIYSEKITSLDDLADGAQIAVPNDPTNEARALLLLQDQGLITLADDAGLAATVIDITDNPKNLEIVEIEAAQLPRSLPDVDAAVINGNYALEAGLSAQTDAIAAENADSETAQAYTNVIAVVSGNENSDKIQALLKALETDEVRQFMEETYLGNVVAVF